MYFGYIGSVLIFVLDLYVIYLILTGPGSPGRKLLWVIIALLLPLVGAILYLLLERS